MQPRQAFSNADLLSVGASRCYIYTLHASDDPTCRPRYVGFTCFPKRREKEHHRIHKNGRKGEWISELLSRNQRAVLTIVHTFRSDDFVERGVVEATWIESYRINFPDLLNDLGGGNGTAKPTDESRKKKSEAMKRHCANPVVKKQRSELLKRRYADPIERAKLNEINKRRTSSAKERKKRSDSQKRRWTNPGEKERHRETMKRCFENPIVRKNYLNAMAKRKMEKLLNEF